MRITALKSTVEAALAPIVKMVSNAKLPIDFHPVLTFQSDKQSLSAVCTLPSQQMSIALLDASFDEKGTSFDVNLEMLRRLVAAATGTRLSIEQDAAHVVLNCDERFIGQLVPITSKPDATFISPKDADTTVLPTNFATFLLEAFNCTGDENDRLALSGVNVSSRGIAATDGHQLFHLPLPLQLKGDVTLPKSKAYAELKHLRWTGLSHWRTASGERMLSIAGYSFRYTAKAVDTDYPQFWRVIPPEGSGDVKLTLTQDGAHSLQSFLDVNKGSTDGILTVHPDRIELAETDDNDVRWRSEVFEARCSGASLPCNVHINPCNLRQFLKMGFRSLSFSPKGPSPLVSFDGTGKYLFMPNRAQSSVAATVTRPAAVAVSTTVNSTPTITKPVTNPTNTQPKEKPTMTQTMPTPTTTYTRPVQPVVAQTPAANPLDETLANLAAMREQLASLEVRLMEAGRKLKAALIEQKQKEHQYAEATRKLERIRLAV